MPSPAVDPLTALANKYETDKGSTYFCQHHYTRHYHRLFQSLRNQPITLLEMGLNSRGRTECASLCMWSDYFSKVTLYGLDILPFTFPKARLYQADQGNTQSLMQACAQMNTQFDIIIEDGSHIVEHQHNAFAAFFPATKPGGYYVVEDLSSQLAGHSWKFFEALSHHNLERAYTLTHLEPDTVRALHARVETIELQPSANPLYGANSIALITKKTS